MALTTEILIFETSEAFRKDPNIATPALDHVLKADGVHAPGYYGTRIEDPGTAYVFLNWDSYEAHKAVMDGPSYPDILGALKPALGGKVEMYHVQFSGPTVALEMPVTEVVVLTLKAPENRAAVVEILSGFAKAIGKILAFGQTREDENKYFLICGWPTVEAHRAAIGKPEVAAALAKLHSLATEDQLYHTSLFQRRLQVIPRQAALDACDQSV